MFYDDNPIFTIKYITNMKWLKNAKDYSMGLSDFCTVSHSNSFIEPLNFHYQTSSSKTVSLLLYTCSSQKNLDNNTPLKDIFSDDDADK